MVVQSTPPGYYLDQNTRNLVTIYPEYGDANIMNAVTHRAVGAPVQEIEDVQSSKDTRRLAINKVGIKDIRHPVRVRDRSAGEQHTVANFSMYVFLPHDFKGTHMSRFVDILNNHEREITVESFKVVCPRGRPEQARAGIRCSEPDGLRRHADG